METYKKIKNMMLDEGYSLVELVAAISVLMILTGVVGTASYNTIQNRQTGSSVKLATQTAYNKALGTITDYDPGTNVDLSIAQSNKEASTQGIYFDWTPKPVNIRDITKDDLCVMGAIKGDTAGVYSHKVGHCGKFVRAQYPDRIAEKPPTTNNTLVDDISKIVYQCNGSGTRNVRLNIANLATGTRATLFGDDESIIPVDFTTSSATDYKVKYRDDGENTPVNNYSELFEIKNGVRYELVIKGKFNNIGTLTHSTQGTTNDITGCMTEIVKLGESSDLKEISSFGANNFAKMTEKNLPSTVTSLRYMFDSASKFNDPNISSLNTSSVIDMSGMFYKATSFNQPLSNWNTSKIQTMESMFEEAVYFNNGDTAMNWKLPAAYNMKATFKGALRLTVDLNWVLSTNSKLNITMESMFEKATLFNGNISNWNVSNVQNTNNMFKNTTIFNRPLSNWDTSKIKTMESMFENAGAFNNGGTAMNWKLPAAHNMKSTFKKSRLTVDLNWVLSTNGDLPITMESMFEEARTFNVNISKWNVSNVRNTNKMFYNASAFNQPISNWDTSKIETMESMFEGAFNFNNGGAAMNWKLPAAHNMKKTFKRASKLTVDLNWVLSTNSKLNITMESMFEGASAFNGNISNWNTSRVTSMSSMFEGASSFNQKLVNGSKWNVSNVTTMKSMFKNAKAFNGKLVAWKVSNVTTMESMFEGASSFNNGEINPCADATKSCGYVNDNILDFQWTSNVTTMKSMFKNATSFNSSLRTGFGGIGNASSPWDVSKVTDMSSMFYNAKSYNQSMSDWNTSSVTYYSGFGSGSRLTAAKLPTNFNAVSAL